MAMSDAEAKEKYGAPHEPILVGQVWRNVKTGRLVEIAEVAEGFDDYRYVWVDGHGGGWCYGTFFRRAYERVS